MRGSTAILGSEVVTLDIPDTFCGVSEAQRSLTSVLNLSHRQLATVNEGKEPRDH